MQTDPNATRRITTAVLPEWAVAATGDARDAEIERLRAELTARDEKIADLYGSLYARSQAINRLERDLADVRAECCRLVCRNGDLEKLAGVVRRVISMFCVERGFGPICEIANALDVIDKKEAQ